MAATGKAEQLSDRSVDIARLVQELDRQLICPTEHTYLIRGEDPGLRVVLAEGARLTASEVQSKFHRPQFGETIAMGSLIKIRRGNVKGQTQAAEKLATIG